MIVYGVEVKRWKIQEYFTREILKIIDLYWKIKNYGLPFGNNWGDNPKIIMDIVFLLDQEMVKRKKIDGKR